MLFLEELALFWYLQDGYLRDSPDKPKSDFHHLF